MPRLLALLSALTLALATACGGSATSDGAAATAVSESASEAQGYAQRAAAQLELETLPARGEDDEIWGRELPLPLVAPDFTLTADDGAAFDYARDADAPLTLVYFGYTSCPDVCPTHLAAISQALDQLGPAERDDVEVLFVSVDPTVDTPERLRSYLDSFDQPITGLTGTPSQINDALTSVGLRPTAIGADAAGPPEHPSSVIGFAGGEGVIAWPFGTTPDIYAHDLQLLTDPTRSDQT